MAVTSNIQAASAWLITVDGPEFAPIDLGTGSRDVLLGRLDRCDIQLPADSVSRNHARLIFDGVRWRIADLKSRWGTFVNGVRLEQGRDAVLGEGDLLRITPWTFRFAPTPVGRAGLLEGVLDSADDLAGAGEAVKTLVAERLPSLGDELLALLLDSSAAIHAAADEQSLAKVLLEKACVASGLPNGAVLKPAGPAGRVQVVESRGPAGSGQIVFSRSLLSAAAGGNVAELSSDRQTFDISQSIVSMGVRSALCVPLMLGQTVAAYLYLDSRGEANSANRLPLRPHASAFCLALGRMAGLALANLKRVEMERRSAEIDAELAAASAAQQWILPKRVGKFGPFTCIGESRPGEYLGGDFYDVIPVGNDRLAVAIGDVSGHGVAASVLMTASAGFLHAVLEETADPEIAINRLNAFLGPRKSIGKFVTMWIGVLDLSARTLRYVDAGHGYVMIGQTDGSLGQITVGENIPLGVDETYRFSARAIDLPASGRLLLLSDGIIEQFSAAGGGEPAAFATAGVERTAQSPAGQSDFVAALFDAVIEHAGRANLSDDATSVLVEW